MSRKFNSCVKNGGRVRRVSGPDKDHGLKAGEYVNYCYPAGTTPGKGNGVRGEVHKAKKE